MRIRLITLFFISSVISLGILYSCQKEPNEKISTELSSKDPKGISAAIKVWHGMRTQGNPPAEKGNILQLDNSATASLNVIAGRYAIIQPQVISGDVSGYYLKIAGAADYFKIDYTRPRNTGRQIKHKIHGSFLRTDSTGGNLDSAIVIVLPADLHVPDTICMTYWAYDNTGNVSNPVDVCIIVNSIGTDANGAWLNGSWNMTAGWDENLPHDTIVYNHWISDVGGSAYYCDTAFGLQVTDYQPGQNFLATDSVFYVKSSLTFNSDGTLKNEFNNQWKTVDMQNSDCSAMNFYPVESDVYIPSGAYSYNSTTHKLIIIYEFDEMGLPIEEAYEFDVIQVDSKNAILIDRSDPLDPYYSRIEK